jgi:hypothetical protein
VTEQKKLVGTAKRKPTARRAFPICGPQRQNSASNANKMVAITRPPAKKKATFFGNTLKSITIHKGVSTAKTAAIIRTRERIKRER